MKSKKKASKTPAKKQQPKVDSSKPSDSSVSSSLSIKPSVTEAAGKLQAKLPPVATKLKEDITSVSPESKVNVKGDKGSPATDSVECKLGVMLN